MNRIKQDKILAIYCAGSLGMEILSMVKGSDLRKSWDKIIFIDDIVPYDKVEGIQVLRYKHFMKMYSTECTEIIIATGEPRQREKLMCTIKEDGYGLATVISRNSYIGMKACIEAGCIIFPNVYISNHVILHENVVVHANAKIEAECYIGKNTFFSSGAFAGARSIIGEASFIGPNATLKDSITIGNYSVIGMGSVVLKNVDNENVLVGNPARIVGCNGRNKIFDSSIIA